MVKRMFLIVAVACLCSLNVSAQDWKSALKDVAKTMVGDKATTAESIVGTWKFSGPDCRFESENLLAKAGGEAAAVQVEQKLEPVYYKLGMEDCVYYFGSDNTYTQTIKGHTSKGTYVFDEDNKTVTMKTKLGVSIKAQVMVTGTSMSLLFNADKLLSVLKSLTDMASKVDSDASIIGALSDNYDGLLLGFELSRQ